MSTLPLIGRGRLERGCLSGRVAVVTGAGGGIGFEAARSLVWLGATVIIAEVDEAKGTAAADRINREAAGWSPVAGETSGVPAYPYPVDVGSEETVTRLADTVLSRHGRVDVVLNNATVAPIGAVADASIADWDLSYRVNLRGPVLLARAFLPGMLERRTGVLVSVPSSGAAPYLGPYEVLKTAQVALADTLDAELENTGVIAFSIGPGIVQTETATAAFRAVAPLYGLSEAEFVALSAQHLLTAESAGAGFAAAVALAEQFAGQEIGSVQALMAAGIEPERPEGAPAVDQTPGRTEARVPSDPRETTAPGLCQRVRVTLEEQSDGWRKRPIFERQWVLRDFRKTAGAPVEQWLAALRSLEASLSATGPGEPGQLTGGLSLSRLAGYYDHLAKLAAGYEKDPVKREETVAIVRGWRHEVEDLIAALSC